VRPSKNLDQKIPRPDLTHASSAFSVSLRMSEAAAAKKQNSACHFCDHAARRSGRHKVAEQVACSLENCRKVFCSRRACIAKLRGPGVPQTIEEFRQWKRVIESGEMFFVCPHCVDQGECQGPQCRKRGQAKQAQQAGDATHAVEAAPSLAQKRSYVALNPPRAGDVSPPSPVLALTVPHLGDLNNLER
jgi:hypothetical protein